MPLYEYACKRCEHEFETLVFKGEMVSCPRCQAENVERLLSVPAKPVQGGGELPMSCNPNLPPCGPGCCRLP